MQQILDESVVLRSKVVDRLQTFKRTSYIEDELTEDEREFLWLVRVGDKEGLKLLLRGNKLLNFDCCDYRGQRALDIAVSYHDVELLEFLLLELKVNAIHYYCAVLRAVFENDANILEMLLDRADDDSKLQGPLHNLMSGGKDCTKCLPEVAATNLTPTMASAINGNTEITRLLLERGYCIQKPHSPKCRCPEHCIRRSLNGETLTESMSRMNAYKALGSPTYLLLTSEDPILSAFQMSRELEKLSYELPENQKEYLELSKQCSTFAAELLNECRNTEEVQTVLSQKEGFSDPRPHRFSRLHLAVQCSQKEFVTHASCQQVLRSMWVEGLGSWYGWSFKKKFFHVIKHSILTPIISLAFIFIPKADIFGPLRVPLNRFIYSATSYIFFLCLLMITLLNDRRYDIQAPVTWTEMALCCFIIGHSWAIIVNLFSMGINNYFQNWWSVFDFIMFSLFLITEFLVFGSFIFNLITDSSTPYNRMTWPWYHPILIGEGIYATASVMAFSRLLLWCHVNSRLGPLGTSIKYMLGDVSRFFVLFFIIMFAFATGINSIYKNYKDSAIIDNGNEDEQPEAFLTLKNTFKHLFWAIFGMGEPDFAQIAAFKNFTAREADGESSEDKEHIFTEGVGYGLWGLYHMVIVIVLLNMLIAMMAETYQRVQLNADLEWKFACSTLWLSVLDSHTVVPVPFNLIPSMHRLVLLFQWIMASVRGSLNGKISWSRNRCCYWDEEPDHMARKIDEEKYERLLVQLIRRYLHCKELRDTNSNSTCFVSTEFKEKMKAEIFQDLRRASKIPPRTYTHRRTRRVTNATVAAVPNIPLPRQGNTRV